MLLSWPPYSASAGNDIIRAYGGRRIIYIGEGEFGCCGDDKMWTTLGNFWEEVATHRPIQWFGLHDYITVYERRALEI